MNRSILLPGLVAAALPATGCPPSPLRGWTPSGTRAGAILSSGESRAYRQHVPAGYAGASAPLVVSFHGFGATALARSAGAAYDSRRWTGAASARTVEMHLGHDLAHWRPHPGGRGFEANDLIRPFLEAHPFGE